MSLDLDAIGARALRYADLAGTDLEECKLLRHAALSADDVPALLAEIERLKSERVVSVIFGHHKGAPRPFALYRRSDVTGVSGTGIVAEGAAFSDGTAVLRWLSEWPTSVVFHDRGMEAIEQIHGHGGATQVVWLSDELEPLAAMEQERDALRAEVERLKASVTELVEAGRAWLADCGPLAGANSEHRLADAIEAMVDALKDWRQRGGER
jgi:hypothetical protein